VKAPREADLLRGPELDQRLGISPATRARWVKSGYLPRPLKIAGTPRWLRSEIEALLQNAMLDRDGESHA